MRTKAWPEGSVIEKGGLRKNETEKILRNMSEGPEAAETHERLDWAGSMNVLVLPLCSVDVHSVPVHLVDLHDLGKPRTDIPGETVE